MTDWKALEDAEDHAYFMAELMDISPESFTLEEKKQIPRDMIESSTAICPLELEEPLAGARRALSSGLGHEPANRRVGAGEPPLLDEPIVDALGGLPLLARGGEVLVEHLLDPGPVAFETGPLPGPPDGGRRETCLPCRRTCSRCCG